MENSGKQKSRELIIPIIVAIVMFIEFLDTTILNTAVPSIARSFAISPVVLKFSIASYFLSLAIFIPISGWCADKFGTKKMFMFSVALFVIASALCALSQDLWQLTLFRFLQGVGGAFMNPVSRIIIVRLFPPKDLIKIQGIIFTPAMLGFVLGPVLGGLITTYLSWHWIFYINIPFGLFALYQGHKYIEQHVAAEPRKLDGFGFIIAAVSLCLITIFVETLNHYEMLTKTQSFMCGFIGVGMFLFLIAYCMKKNAPVFDFSLFRLKTFRVGFNVNLSMYAINASIAFLLPLMFQECFHLSPAHSGVLVIPIAVGYVVGRFFATKVIRHIGFRKAICNGLICFSICIVLLGFINSLTSVVYITLVEFVLGLATTSVGAATGALNYVDVPHEKAAPATSIDLTFRQFASSLGIGLTAFVLTSLNKTFGIEMFSPNATIFHLTFYMLAGLALVALRSGLKLNADDGAHALKKK